MINAHLVDGGEEVLVTQGEGLALAKVKVLSVLEAEGVRPIMFLLQTLKRLLCVSAH